MESSEEVAHHTLCEVQEDTPSPLVSRPFSQGDGVSSTEPAPGWKEADVHHYSEWSLKGERRQFRCTEDKCAEPGVLLTSLSGDEGRKVESLQTQGAPGPYLPPAPPGMFRSASAAPRSVSAVGAAAAPQAPERVGLLHSLGTRPSAVP
ncbi:unnamed protein product [Rangifer tarandus platyrhynchus]|uniref:Uncharacterized protein n=1 Tax=Rangifer tarandus platyrhynchus TaxID=3082113 RepID=A0AC59Z6K3_RANTA